MSYRGRPSKGCEACRARKVKCDEAKPRCNRCSRLGHECQYRDQSDLLFRNQTTIAAQRAEESWRKRSKSHQRALSETSAFSGPATGYPIMGVKGNMQLLSHNLQPAIFDPIIPKTLPNGKAIAAASSISEKPSIPSSLRQDICRLAYERFVYDFVASEDPNRPPEEPSDALFSFVPLLYQHSAPDSCLTTIVNAVAYINFANRCNAPQAATLAEESFGESIRILSSIITNTAKASSNDALCSVHLMGIFETLTNFQRQGTFAAHQHGANALLQLRTPEQYYNNHVSARLYEVAYAQMLLASLQAAKFPTIPVQDTVNVRKYFPSLYNEFDTFVIRLIWREAQLHARWHEIKQNATLPTCRYDLQELLQVALDLDAEYQAWEDALPSAWQYETKLNTPEARSAYSTKWQKLVLTCKGAPEEIHTYSNLKRCSLWGYYRTSRIFLLRDTLEILNWMFRLPATKQSLPPRSGQGITVPAISNTTTSTEKSRITSLNDLELRNLQSAALTRMIDVIEQSCAVILGSFTVPMYKKSPEDVMGMRGHIVLWSLGIMDSVLSSGLIPDSNDSATSPAATSLSPLRVRSAPPTGQGFEASFLHDTTLAPATHGFDPFPPLLEHRHSDSLPLSQDNQQSPPITPPEFVAIANKEHPFDSTPRHPYDSHVLLPPLDASAAEPKTINVSAKRVWLNSMLYYIGTELGIKKALIVPHAEGYIPIVKPFVDEILGR